MKLKPISLLLLPALMLLMGGCGGEDSQSDTSTAPIDAPVVFSPGQAASLLLEKTDFPDDWGVTRNTEGLTVRGGKRDYNNVRTMNVALEPHDTEAMAQTAFANRKAEAEAIIAARKPTITNNKLFSA